MHRVRRAKPRDAGALVALARAVGEEPEGWFITDGEWRTVGDERRYLRAAGRSADAAVLVAEVEDRIVGRLSVVRDQHPASRHVADVGLMVALPFRRQGIGRALLAAAEEWARSAGIVKLELHVFPHNEAAIQLYESAGYVRDGYRSRHFRRGNELIDAILMSKDTGEAQASPP
jgi:RimJ/RimL family protein N-acetyltransferase